MAATAKAWAGEESAGAWGSLAGPAVLCALGKAADGSMQWPGAQGGGDPSPGLPQGSVQVSTGAPLWVRAGGGAWAISVGGCVLAVKNAVLLWAGRSRRGSLPGRRLPRRPTSSGASVVAGRPCAGTRGDSGRLAWTGKVVTSGHVCTGASSGAWWARKASRVPPACLDAPHPADGVNPAPARSSRAPAMLPSWRDTVVPAPRALAVQWHTLGALVGSRLPGALCLQMEGGVAVVWAWSELGRAGTVLLGTPQPCGKVLPAAPRRTISSS